MNFRMIGFLMGHIMRVVALFMAPAAAISGFQGETASWQAFLLTMLLLVAASLPMLRQPLRKTFYAREGFVVVGLAWIVVSLFGAMPFFFSGAIPNFVDCFFETASGFTTTGASILREVESLPMGILYWRSFTHWLGGMGVLVFVLAVLPMAKGAGYSVHLLRAESPGPQVGKLVPKMHQTAKILYSIYVGMTLLQILLLLAGRMPLFDAVTAAFGTAGTGGFAIKNDSMASYSVYIQAVITIFMALFGINFNIFYLLLIRKFSKAFSNEELRAYLGIMLSAICLITWNLMAHGSQGLLMTFHHAAFQVSSIMTTTGFATTDFNLWPELSRALLVLLMILGASAGSTGGGIKTARVLILFKTAKNDLHKLLRPRSVKLVQMDDQVVEDGTIRGVYAFMTCYCAICIVSVLLVSLDNFSLETNITAVLACLNNIGPGLGLVGPLGNYADFSIFSKLVLSADMLLGRLEIFPLLLLFTPSVWKRTV